MGIDSTDLFTTFYTELLKLATTRTTKGIRDGDRAGEMATKHGGPSKEYHLRSIITEGVRKSTRVKILDPKGREYSSDEELFPNHTKNPPEPISSEGLEYQCWDVPPHQTPNQPPLKPGNIRPGGYKYTPFPKNPNLDPNLRQSRRRLCEILEEVESERNEGSVGTHAQKSTIEERPLDNESNQSFPIRQDPQVNKSTQSERTLHEDNSAGLTNDEIRIQSWEQRSSRGGRQNQNSSNDSPKRPDITPPNPPPPPPPPPSSPPPPPSPPPNKDNNDSHYPSIEESKTVSSIRVKDKNQTDNKNIRDVIARESKLEIRKPTAFDGSNRELWRPFLSDCYRMFSAKPTIYSTEQSKVTYASSWFTGAAAKYYQNQVEQEMENDLWIPALHEWSSFVAEFGRLFGLHDEVLYAQSSLDKVLQKFGKSFVDFIVRFEDAALKTMYNDPAKRWRLLLQICKDLRDRLTLVGRIPEKFDEVVKRLLDIDGAREAFRETGLAFPNPNYQVRRLAPSNTKLEDQQNSTPMSSTPLPKLLKRKKQ
ncbi:hypothetical protein K435DRAFT_808535 [Dendrothele bispora CBS 962.96]|uniref:Retrotransposon gag domain-containing protein n=1 Tax=Dendrothele bispora (strain CBS 962.96) TaxID=1314807 RepID=A0A4V4HC66_DENBC|nr:hypothetical protein K435DRAFT_808535 [Dendrothele bispora CBS 962.96]